MPARPQLSPEARLVFRSADPRCAASELEQLAGEVTDWGRALLLAEHEGAVPALWGALRSARAAVPADAREFLRTRTMMSDFRMQQLSGRLQETIAEFAARRIPVILLKGAAIGALADPTFRLRPMTDVDLLVKPEDAARAREAALAAGWEDHPDERLKRLLDGHQHLPPFVDPRLPGLRLELHTALFPARDAFALDAATLWRDATPCAEPFAGAMLLSPPHLFVHLAVHFAWQHSISFAPWRTLRAVAVLTAVPSWSWEDGLRASRDARAGTCAHWTLRMCERLGRIPLPTGVVDDLAPPTPAWLMRMLERHFLAQLVPGEGPVSPSIKTSRLLWRAALRPRWSGHRHHRHGDANRRWLLDKRDATDESGLARLRRHASNYRAWWRFIKQTLVG